MQARNISSTKSSNMQTVTIPNVKGKAKYSFITISWAYTPVATGDATYIHAMFWRDSLQPKSNLQQWFGNKDYTP
jgi:hypothetical protein